MIAKVLDLSVPRGRGLRRPDTLVVMTTCAFLLGTAIRVMVGGDQPLWLDETFTGAIAASPTYGDVLYQIMQDVNAPLYLLLAHANALVFGLSNEALRLPSLAFGCAAPLLCLAPTPGISRRTALIWCAAMSLWCPGLVYAQEARCYTLLMALSLVTVLCFARLLHRPTPGRAFAWAAVGCLAILTHYHALVLVGCQGLVFLAIHRRRAISIWPTATLFVPVFVWLYLHRGPILAFSAPNVAWYRTINASDLPNILSYLSGSLAITLLVAGMLAVAFRGLFDRDEASSGERGGAVLVWAPTLASCAAAAVVLVIAAVKPSFTIRYLIPFVPGTLLGVALVCEQMKARWVLVSRVVLVIFAIMAIEATRGRSPDDKIYNFQVASDWLIEAKVKHAVFFWDNPNNLVENPAQLAIVGGFFFKRRGVDVDVLPFKNVRHEDPNPALVALADTPSSAILWVYDAHVHDTAARTFPPRLALLDATLRCQDFARPPFGVVACVRSDRHP